MTSVYTFLGPSVYTVDNGAESRPEHNIASRGLYSTFYAPRQTEPLLCDKTSQSILVTSDLTFFKTYFSCIVKSSALSLITQFQSFFPSCFLCLIQINN